MSRHRSVNTSVVPWSSFYYTMYRSLFFSIYSVSTAERTRLFIVTAIHGDSSRLLMADSENHNPVELYFVSLPLLHTWRLRSGKKPAFVFLETNRWLGKEVKRGTGIEKKFCFDQHSEPSRNLSPLLERRRPRALRSPMGAKSTIARPRSISSRSFSLIGRSKNSWAVFEPVFTPAIPPCFFRGDPTMNHLCPHKNWNKVSSVEITNRIFSAAFRYDRQGRWAGLAVRTSRRVNSNLPPDFFRRISSSNNSETTSLSVTAVSLPAARNGERTITMFIHLWPFLTESPWIMVVLYRGLVYFPDSW